jgi:hypothetical protein
MISKSISIAIAYEHSHLHGTFNSGYDEQVPAPPTPALKLISRVAGAMDGAVVGLDFDLY